LAFRIIRKATASWSGTASQGQGRLGLGSGAFEGVYTERGRVEDGQSVANPEEMIGAALAGCFTMSVADLLSKGGNPPALLETTARVHLAQTDTGFAITRIELDTVGQADGVDEAAFVTAAEQAKATCPIAKALAGPEITLQARLAPPATPQ
jgi:osmotically inducible protein OsmC